MESTLTALQQRKSHLEHCRLILLEAYSAAITAKDNHKAWTADNELQAVQSELEAITIGIYMEEMESIDLSVLLPDVCYPVAGGPVLILKTAQP